MDGFTFAPPVFSIALARNNMLRSTILTLLVAVTINAQESKLGRVEFQTSGSPAAQTPFLRGLAALHSFWYEEALEAFRESTKADPDFMMGYWGEAMAHNHPLWSEQDLNAARQVIAKIKDTPKLTDRERAYLNAVKLLFGEGDKRARDAAYSAAMEKSTARIPKISMQRHSILCLYLVWSVQVTDRKSTRLNS